MQNAGFLMTRLICRLMRVFAVPIQHKTGFLTAKLSYKHSRGVNAIFDTILQNSPFHFIDLIIQKGNNTNCMPNKSTIKNFLSHFSYLNLKFKIFHVIKIIQTQKNMNTK